MANRPLFYCMLASLVMHVSFAISLPQGKAKRAYRIVEVNLVGGFEVEEERERDPGGDVLPALSVAEPEGSGIRESEPVVVFADSADDSAVDQAARQVTVDASGNVFEPVGSGSKEADPELISWLKQVRRRLRRAMVYPRKARSESLEGSATLQWTILPDGRADEIEIVKTSGKAILDTTARSIVRRAAPFPRNGHNVRIRLTMPVVFRLD